jgi:hypothetical protein
MPRASPVHSPSAAAADTCPQLMGLISSRDFIDACAVRPLPDGGLITAASAVDGFPETPGCVRGKNRSCGLTFRPTGMYHTRQSCTSLFLHCFGLCFDCFLSEALFHLLTHGRMQHLE